ncbi:MAG: cytochrome c oxidase assembly protein [Alphaproteobacteria bacterium]
MRRRNARCAAGLFALVLAMGGLTYASAPLYRLFCQATGFGGAPRVAEAAPEAAALPAEARTLTVRFDANVHPDLPWSFKPAQRELELRVGETALGHYLARNQGASPSTGTATFNVTPAKAGRYVNKLACFCFEAKTLAPGEEALMAVSFFVDPAIMGDRNLDDVRAITLSYTFFRDQAVPQPTGAVQAQATLERTATESR